MKILMLLFVSLFLLPSSYSAEILSFKNEEDKARYHHLIAQIRCPKCQNQSIADSNAGISEDLRNLVYQKVNAGESNRDIKQFLLERYGDFVLYEPPVKGVNIVLWVAPIVVLLLVALFVYFILNRKKSNGLSRETLTNEEEERLAKMLMEEDK